MKVDFNAFNSLDVDAKFNPGERREYDPRDAIALSQARSLKRIADVLERAESKILSDTSRGFFRKIVKYVMEYP